MIINLDYQDYWSYWFKSHCSTHSESNIEGKNLVVSFGDSWTWGDSLNNSKIHPDNDNEEYRLNNVYGGLIAKKINANFVNISFPGAGNYWILDRFRIFVDKQVKQLSKQYENVYVVITLTEIGRLLEFEKYTNELSIDNHDDYNSVLKNLEKFDFDIINDLSKNLPSNIKVFVGRNFTDTFDDNKKLLTNVRYIKDTWLDLLFKEQNFSYKKNCRIVSIIGHEPFYNYMTNNVSNKWHFKDWFTTNILEPGLERITLLEKSKLNYKKATKHPTEEGHAIWANYLETYIE